MKIILVKLDCSKDNRCCCFYMTSLCLSDTDFNPLEESLSNENRIKINYI